MKEYDPESGTYKNAQIDAETKEIRYGECPPDEDEIVYKRPKLKKVHLHLSWWGWSIIAVAVLAPWIVLLILHPDENKMTENELEPIVKKTIKIIESEENSLTIMDSSAVGQAYTEVIDTTVYGHPLRIYRMHYGVPELYVCDSADLDIDDTNIVFAARAADISKKRELIGFFIYKGQVLATESQHKEGFCAIIDHNITLGIGKTTPLLEQAIEDSGYFFRNEPLVIKGIELEHSNDQASLRRALCNLNNEMVYVEGLEKMTFCDFSSILVELGVTEAVNMVGSKGGHGFCRDREGVLHTWGVNRYYRNHKNVNYLIWRKK